jgi:hypothetical protein
MIGATAGIARIAKVAGIADPREVSILHLDNHRFWQSARRMAKENTR